MVEIETFEKIVPEGKALARWHDKALFVVGPLPGESARVRVTREKPTWAEGVAEKLTVLSPHRHEALEPHFMSCSPWQGVEYSYQLELKRGMLAETFARPGLELAVEAMVASPMEMGYRDKLEFVFGAGLELSLHERGGVTGLVPATGGCVLGSEAMNAAAQAAVERARELDLGELAESLVVRQSYTHGEVVVVLVLKARARRDWQRLVTSKAAGVVVAYQNKDKRLEMIWSRGVVELRETLGGVDLAYPWDAFFQVNVPAFGRALERILTHIKQNTKVVDLYGGAGTIGLPVARVAREVVGIELQGSAVELANINARSNGIVNYQAHVSSSERVDSGLLEGVDTIIVDPPRAGLSPRAVALLLAVKPRQVVYLSCNPVTQARDIMLLQEAYSPSGVTGFDFYPGTLHVESLVALTLR